MEKKVERLNFCINISVPSADDDSISLYECVCNIANTFNIIVEQLNNFNVVTSVNGESGAVELDLSGAVKSVNGMTGAVQLDLSGAVKSVNGKTGAVVIPTGGAVAIEGGTVPELTQEELKAYIDDGISILIEFTTENAGISYYIYDTEGGVKYAKLN